MQCASGTECFNSIEKILRPVQPASSYLVFVSEFCMSLIAHSR